MKVFPFPRSAFILLITLGLLVLASGCRDGGIVASEEDQLAALQTEALRLTAIFNFNAAGPVFDELRALSEPNSEQWSLATFGAATAAWHTLPPNSANVSKAEGLFIELTQVLEPPSPFWARAHLNLGRMAELENFPGDTVDPERASEHYRAVIEQMANTTYADEAAGRLAANATFAYREPEILRAELLALETYLAARPDSPIGATLWSFLGETYWRYLRDGERAHHAYLQSELLGSPEGARQWMVYWRMGVIAENELQRPDLALQHFQWIVDNAPRSPRIYEARLAINRIREANPLLQ